ncbi:carboxylating nicotinate-nucleotide diphosphorylase [Phycisphaerales bacterium AB-hyl4]|uniref:nicotinate-nucleotide diphosphorylase (carboxylating) n=1 Tax=Natronomicrosphaera hydrolytica TaxID=3242702 RepID=A0ABV4U0J5_9BACT
MIDTDVMLDGFASADDVAGLVQRAREEDVGPNGLDVTSRVLIAAERSGDARMVAREAGVVAGLAVLPAVAKAYDGRIEVTCGTRDGAAVVSGQTVARFVGPVRSLLAMERVALNFVSHLSGIATHTAAYVAATKGTKARVCDTRKTLPGLRSLQKYAVACGGGATHRMGLHDAMLIKDNHLVGVSLEAMTDTLRDAIGRARAMYADLKFVEVEVDTLEQLEHVLPCGAEMVLLDNMSVEQLRQAVAMRDAAGVDVLLEASGGVTLDATAAIAATGVDRISVGGLTHSVRALDFGLDM